MTGGQWVRRVLKPTIWLAASGPSVWLLWCFFSGDLGHDPVKTITWTTGLSALILLLCTLAIRPLRALSGWQGLVLARRLVGLWAYWYALLHFLTYALFDREFSLAGIGEDIAKRPWITVGFSAFLILTVLASTSPKRALRALGGARWRSLHRLVYVAAVLGFFHFLWLVKLDTREPMVYGLILLVLLVVRSPMLGRWFTRRGSRSRKRPLAADHTQ